MHLMKTASKSYRPVEWMAAVVLIVLPCARLGAQEQEGPARGKSPEEIKAAVQQARSQQAEKAATAQSHPNNPELWNVDQMMEEAVLQISRRYNLNKAQEDYTRLLLTNRVRAFLDIHEQDVRELLRESIDMRLGIKPGTADEYMRWAARAAPIYNAAQQAILDGNEEWGVILDVEQKKIHEADLSAMRTSFAQVDRMLENWKAGQGPAGGIAVAQPQPQTQQGLAGGGTAVTQARVSNPQTPVIQQHIEDTWQAYVNRFIHTYGLDEKQAISARDKIYKDIRDQANQYRERRKAEFSALNEEAYARKPKTDLKAIDRRRHELERPLGEMFVLLDKRLRTLPDAKQIANADAKNIEHLEAMYKMLAGEFGAAPEKADDKKSPAADAGPTKPASESGDAPKSAAEAKPEEVKSPAPKKDAPADSPEPGPGTEKAPS